MARNRRDWTNLAAGPAGLIAARLLACDVADYVRFRAVCSAWRACSDDPRTQSVFDRRYHPRRWIMLRLAMGARGRRRFLNVSTGECVHLRLPDLRRYYVLGPTVESLLVLCRKGTLVVQLLNPLTGQLTDLPRVNTLLKSRASYQITADKIEDFLLLSAGLADYSMVALHFDFCTLAVAKPGDKTWTRFNTMDDVVLSALPFAGRLYCATPDNVMVLEAATARQPPELVVAADLEFDRSGTLCFHLVDNDGELTLTNWLPPSPNGQRHAACKVYRVDLDAGKTVAVPRIDGNAVFISSYGGRALSVPVGLSPSISADTVYFCKCHIGKADQLNLDAYSLVDGRIVEDCRTKYPSSIVDNLSRYVGELERW